MVDVGDQRQAAWPLADSKALQHDLLRSVQPTSSLFSSAVGNTRYETDDQVDTEVIIWSSKTGDSGVGLNRLEPRQRPYSVAAFPIDTRRRGDWSARSDFEETTATSRAAVSWQPPVSTPVSHPVPPAEENRRPAVAANSFNHQYHQQSMPLGAEELSSMNGGTGFRNDNYSTLSLGRRPPMKTPEPVDFSDDFPPSTGRRHSALPASPAAMTYGIGNGAATSELFLSRSGIVTGNENDVIESSKRS